MSAPKRVVSLVPSWTETLLACGVEVVGRTRFCVHPDSAKKIPVVGGTKDLNLEEVARLKPDLLLLDKEENLPWMAEEKAWRSYVSHVSSLQDMPRELNALAEILENEKLRDLAREWEREIEKKRQGHPPSVMELPGVLEWIRRPSEEPEKILYLIWRDPWMAVSASTFIGSMLAHLGYGAYLPEFSERYPKVDLESFDPARTLLLFSSEPYPFGKKVRELKEFPFPSALVDGEAYSWFGLRSLRFLKGTGA